MATSKGITRRDIITGAAGAAAAASVASCFPNVGGRWPDAPPPGPEVEPTGACGCSGADAGTSSTDDSPSSPVQGSSLVATVQRNDSLDTSKKPVQDVVNQMVADMLSALVGGDKNPWPKLLPKVDLGCVRVGLKINCLPGGKITTRPEVVEAVVKSLTDGGVCAGNIFFWDRYLTDLQIHNYPTQILGANAIATAERSDASGAAIAGKMKGYGPPWGVIDGAENAVEKKGLQPRVSRVLTDQTDVTIHIPVLKAHPESGFTASFKDCYGMIDTPGKYHHPSTQAALPKIFAIPAIRNSIKLTIVDALIASIQKDNISPADRWPGRLFASVDPLAVDYYALDFTNELRSKKLPGWTPQVVDPTLLSWMENAYQAGLGAKSYNLVTVGQTNSDAGATPDATSGSSTIDAAESQSG